MKKFILLAFPLFFSIGLSYHQLTAQCWENGAIPHPSLSEDYDGRKYAYITKGNLGEVDWKNTGGESIWERCKGKNDGNFVEDPNPTPKNTLSNNIYIQISSGDFVTVPEISMHNNITLVVCGHLKVKGETSSVPDGDLGIHNNTKIIICEGGILELDKLEAHNNTDLIVDGTLIVQTIQGHNNNNNCISGVGIIVGPNGEIPNYSGFNLNCPSSDFSGILPIDLLSFTSDIRPDRINILWTTATEINNDYFTIERSTDLYGWEVLGHVRGSGNSSLPLDYNFSDMSPLDELAYYRLKQTDFDGKYKYYGPITAYHDPGMEGFEFKVNKSLEYWVITVSKDGPYLVQVYNLSGRLLHSEQVENYLSIPAPHNAVVIRVTNGLERSTSKVVM